MAKAAILVLADTETHGDLGRLVNALVAAREFKEAGDEVKVVFDGAATKWPGLLTDPKHVAHRPYQDVQDIVAGVCGYCAKAFEAEGGAADAHVHTLEEYHGHPSIRRMVADGYQVITF